jgi:hypothetical protein
MMYGRKSRPSFSLKRCAEIDLRQDPKSLVLQFVTDAIHCRVERERHLNAEPQLLRH